MIAGKSLNEWRIFARRDDCLEKMVPSDLREIIVALTRVREGLIVIANVGSGNAQQEALETLRALDK